MNNPYPDFDFGTTKDDLAVCIDLSDEFVNGALGSEDACATIPWAAWFLNNFQGAKAYTMDTHNEDYLDTQEGRRLPIVHGQKGTHGWQLVKPIADTIRENDTVFEKNTFGSDKLFEYVRQNHFKNIYLLGRCTGYCVLACAVMAKTGDPEANIIILSKLCTCVTEESHATALSAMRTLQMDIL